jgi:hypothetical protein
VSTGCAIPSQPGGISQPLHLAAALLHHPLVYRQEAEPPSMKLFSQIAEQRLDALSLDVSSGDSVDICVGGRNHPAKTRAASHSEVVRDIVVAIVIVAGPPVQLGLHPQSRCLRPFRRWPLFTDIDLQPRAFEGRPLGGCCLPSPYGRLSPPRPTAKTLPRPIHQSGTSLSAPAAPCGGVGEHGGGSPRSPWADRREVGGQPCPCDIAIGYAAVPPRGFLSVSRRFRSRPSAGLCRIPLHILRAGTGVPNQRVPPALSFLPVAGGTARCHRVWRRTQSTNPAAAGASLRLRSVTR